MPLTFRVDIVNQVILVLALIVVGCVIALILGGMTRRFPFSRLALVLALAPISFSHFFEELRLPTLYLYAMIVVLIGITIDGLSYLLKPRTRTIVRDGNVAVTEQEESQADVIEWKKAR